MNFFLLNQCISMLFYKKLNFVIHLKRLSPDAELLLRIFLLVCEIILLCFLGVDFFFIVFSLNSLVC